MLSIGLFVITGALIVYAVVKLNNRYWQKQNILWQPHCESFGAKAVSKYKWAGETNGIPLHWRLYSIGGGSENTTREESFFEIYLQYPTGGKAWRVFYNVPGLMNHRPKGWTIETKDTQFAKALTEAGIEDMAATLSRHYVVHYAEKKGRLICEARATGFGYVTPVEEFTRVVRSLERMGAANQELKAVVV